MSLLVGLDIATGITQTGASGGAALGPLVFGLVVEAFSYDVAWLVSGMVALAALAAILTGRRMVHERWAGRFRRGDCAVAPLQALKN